MEFDKPTLYERLGGDEELIRVLMADALVQIPGDLARLESSLAGAATTDALHLVHKLKGIALNLCFPRVAAISAAMEDGLRSPGTDPGLLARMDDLKAAWAAVEAELRSLS